MRPVTASRWPLSNRGVHRAVLNFIYYPVSAILWFWHKVFGAIPFLGPDSGIAWALSVVFLVFTLRLVLYKPFVKQVRTTRQMQELQPQIKALQKKYAGDRQRQAMELQKLQKEVAGLDDTMAAADPSDFEGLGKLAAQKTALQDEIDELELRWLELGEALE